MKLIRCYHCDKYSSADLRDCPHCGAELVRYETAPVAGAGFAPIEAPTTATRWPSMPRSRGGSTWMWLVMGLGLGCCWLISMAYLMGGKLASDALVSFVLFAVVSVGGLAIYLLPTCVAMARGRRQATAIGVLNVLLGWTFIGWAIALVWACMRNRD